jgi:hypothetical protein
MATKGWDSAAPITASTCGKRSSAHHNAGFPSREIATALPCRCRSPKKWSQPWGFAFFFRKHAALHERVVELIIIGSTRPRFFAHHAHGGAVQFAKVFRSCGIECVAHTNRTGTTFLQRRRIEEGIGLRIDDLVR